MAGSVLVGAVKSYNGNKGFGFIASEVLGVDVFFARSDLPAEMQQVWGSFLEGRPVTFTAAAGSDGRQKVASLHIPYVEGQPLAGTIKSYSSKNGYGFITSSSVTEDVRFQKSDLPFDAGDGNLQGEHVTFEVTATPDGKLRVSKLSFQNKETPARLQQMAMMNMMMGGMPGKGMPMMGKGMPVMGKGNQWPMMGQMSQMSGQVTGTVKSYSEKNGYGFINTPDFPGDIKFGKAELVNCETVSSGEYVSFVAGYAADGRMIADQVSSLGGGKGGKKRPVSALGEGQFSPQTQATQRQRVSEVGTGQYATGSIKSFNCEKGFGFISSPSIPTDVFFMKSSLPGSRDQLPGSNVCFEIAQTSDGKVRALNITMAA